MVFLDQLELFEALSNAKNLGRNSKSGISSWFVRKPRLEQDIPHRLTHYVHKYLW